MHLGPFLQHHIHSAPNRRVKFGQQYTRKANKIEVTSRKWRLMFIVGIGMVSLMLLGGRLWQLQIIQGEQNRAASRDNSFNLKIIPAPRGLIYDVNGSVIARNEPSFRVAITYAKLPPNEQDKMRLSQRLSELLKIEAAQIQQSIDQAQNQPFLPHAIGPHFSRDSQRQMIIEINAMPGVSFEQVLRRHYVDVLAMSHIVGYTGAIQEGQEVADGVDYYPGEDVGIAGIEQVYEKYLHGVVGRQFSQVNALGQSQNRQSVIEPQPGHDIHLSVDAGLQRQVYASLEEAIEKYNTKGAAAVFQHPVTGEVLSLVSAPGYDANAFVRGISNQKYQEYTSDPLNPLFNRVIAGTYPPGSTVKPQVAAAAIEEEVITADTIIDSPNQISVGGSTFADWTYWLGRSGPGRINVIDAIAQSTDTFFYKIGGGYEGQPGLGVDLLFDYYSKFGLGSPTGIDLPGESRGVVPNLDWKKEQFPADPGWYVGNTYQLSIGQSYLLSTPLQINVMTSAVANGGLVIEPQLVSKISTPSGQVVQEFSTEIKNKDFISRHALEVAEQGMRHGVEDGIIFPLRDNPMKVAAKTGTAEFGFREIPDQYGTHSWITGYAPYDNPNISFTILLEGGGSSTNAAEVANQILQWYFDNRVKNTPDQK